MVSVSKDKLVQICNILDIPPKGRNNRDLINVVVKTLIDFTDEADVKAAKRSKKDVTQTSSTKSKAPTPYQLYEMEHAPQLKAQGLNPQEVKMKLNRDYTSKQSGPCNVSPPVSGPGVFASAVDPASNGTPHGAYHPASNGTSNPASNGTNLASNGTSNLASNMYTYRSPYGMHAGSTPFVAGGVRPVTESVEQMLDSLATYDDDNLRNLLSAYGQSTDGDRDALLRRSLGCMSRDQARRRQL